MKLISGIIDKIKDRAAEGDCPCYRFTQNLEDCDEDCELGTFDCGEHAHCYYPNIIKKALQWWRIRKLNKWCDTEMKRLEYDAMIPEMLDALIEIAKECRDVDRNYHSNIFYDMPKNAIERATGLTIDEAIKAWEASQ